MTPWGMSATQLARLSREMSRDAVRQCPETFQGIAHPVQNSAGLNVRLFVEVMSRAAGSTSSTWYHDVGCDNQILQSLSDGQLVECGYIERAGRKIPFVIGWGRPSTLPDDGPVVLQDIWYYLRGNIKGIGACGGATPIKMDTVPPSRLGGPQPDANYDVILMLSGGLGVVYVVQDNNPSPGPEELHLLTYENNVDTLLFRFDAFQPTLPQQEFGVGNPSGKTDTSWLDGVERFCVQNMAIDVQNAYVVVLDKDDIYRVLTIDLAQIRPTAAYAFGTHDFRMIGEPLSIQPFVGVPVLPKGRPGEDGWIPLRSDIVVAQLGKLGGFYYVDLSDTVGKTIGTQGASYDPNADPTVGLRDFGLLEWSEGYSGQPVLSNFLHPTSWTNILGWGGPPGREGFPNLNKDGLAAAQLHRGLLYCGANNRLVPTVRETFNDLTALDPVSRTDAQVLFHGGWRDRAVWTHQNALCIIGQDVLVWFNEWTGTLDTYHAPTILGTPGNGPGLATYAAAITVAAGHCAPGGVTGDHGAAVASEAQTALSALPDFEYGVWSPLSNRSGLRRVNCGTKAVSAEWVCDVADISVTGRKAAFQSGGQALASPSIRFAFASGTVTPGQTLQAGPALGVGTDEVVLKGWTVLQQDNATTGATLGTTLTTSVIPTIASSIKGNITAHVWWGALIGSQPHTGVKFNPTDLSRHGLLVCTNPSETRMVRFPQVQTGAWIYGSPFAGVGGRGDLSLLALSDLIFFVDGIGDAMQSVAPCDPITGAYSPPTLLVYDVTTGGATPNTGGFGQSFGGAQSGPTPKAAKARLTFLRKVPLPDPGADAKVVHPGEQFFVKQVRYGLPAWRSDDLLYWIRRMNQGGTWVGTLCTYNHLTDEVTSVDMWSNASKDFIPINLESGGGSLIAKDAKGTIYRIP